MGMCQEVMCGASAADPGEPIDLHRRDPFTRALPAKAYTRCQNPFTERTP
jgi:hypothetical protein